MPSPFDQSTYQVRLEWGVEGLRRLERADVVVVVDVLRFSSSVVDAVAAGVSVPLAEAVAWSRNGAAVAAAAEPSVVLLAGLRNASAVARAIVAVQERRQARTSVSVVAAGELDEAGALRFAVEDHLGAGAVIAALTDLGIDHTSPDAAVAAEAFRALRRALRHMIAASGSARELSGGVSATDRMVAGGVAPTPVADAAELDAIDAVPILDDGIFVAVE